ncbi:MAG: DNA-binding protein [Proteobacteria bacterium]|nr:DNA-binding protein [Pseudomonadota bacterium]MBS0598874.1 DNA-binding protein [Pseudomonadota bacterium]
MARGGLYKTDIQKARASLLAQGKHPSVDAVRVALGNTGSKTTIHRYLKEIEAEEGHVGDKVAISDALQDLVGRLAQQLHAEAEALVAEGKAKADAIVRDRDDALAQRTHELDGLRGQLQTAEHALASEKAAHAAAQQALRTAEVTRSQLDERIAGLDARIAAQDAHAASLERKHDQAREALEHFRTATREQRDQELRRHEHQVQGLQAELRVAQQTIGTKNHELLQVNRDAVRLTEQAGQLGKELQAARASEREQREAHAALLPVREELLALRTKWALDAQSLANTVDELAACRSELIRERQARSAAERTAVALQARAEATEQLLARWPAPPHDSADPSDPLG